MPTAIETNRVLAKLLGWTPQDFECTDFDNDLVGTITAFQKASGLSQDGICGKHTYGALLAERQRSLIASQARTLGDAGVIAVCEAKMLWLKNIIDLPPPGDPRFEECRLAIDSLIRTDRGLDWTWQAEYRDNYEWCGAFAAFAWRAAGLNRDLRFHFWSSTYRLDLFGRYAKFDKVANPRPTTGELRKIVELDERSGPMDARFAFGDPPRAGDILLVGGRNTAYGKHVTLVESFDESTGVFTTLEGNATGPGPSGGIRHGVIRHKRRVGLLSSEAPTTYHARRLIRVSPHDLA